MTFYYFLFAGIFALILWIGFREPDTFDRRLLVWPALIGACFVVAVVVGLVAGQDAVNAAILWWGGVGIPGTLRGLSFIVTVLLAAFISRERISSLDMLAVGLAFAAVALVALQRR